MSGRDVVEAAAEKHGWVEEDRRPLWVQYALPLGHAEREDWPRVTIAYNRNGSVRGATEHRGQQIKFGSGKAEKVAALLSWIAQEQPKLQNLQEEGKIN